MKSCLKLSKLRPKYCRSLFPDKTCTFASLSDTAILRTNYRLSRFLLRAGYFVSHFLKIRYCKRNQVVMPPIRMWPYFFAAWRYAWRGQCCRASACLPSICLPVFVYCVETSKYVGKLVSSAGSFAIPVLPYKTLGRNYDGVLPKASWGMKKITIFDQYRALSRKRYKIRP